MKFFQSTIGLKITMALSGLVLIGFVIGHMLGNLQVFLGAAVLNSYATMLHDAAALIWLSQRKNSWTGATNVSSQKITQRNNHVAK